MLWAKVDVGNQTIEFEFSTFQISCSSPLCGKSHNLSSGQRSSIEKLQEYALASQGGAPQIIFCGETGCPFCAEKTRYRVAFVFSGNDICYSASSINVISLIAHTSLGDIEYIRSPGDPTDDPNFNFTENINKGVAAYFYNFENQTDAVEILQGRFLRSGEFCIGVFDPDKSEHDEPTGIFGPAVILNHGVILVNNKKAVACEAIYDSDGNLISPAEDPEIFKDRVVLCFKNSPPWTRRRQTTLP